MSIIAPIPVYPDSTSVVLKRPEELCSSKVRLGFEYWLILRGDRPFPGRDEIKPREIAAVLSHMVLVKVVNERADYQFRIVGDHASRGYDVDLTNRMLSEVATLLPRASRNWNDIFGQVVVSGVALAAHVSVGHDAPDVNYTEAEVVFLPLGGMEQRVEYVLCFVEHVLKA